MADNHPGWTRQDDSPSVEWTSPCGGVFINRLTTHAFPASQCFVFEVWLHPLRTNALAQYVGHAHTLADAIALAPVRPFQPDLL